MRACACDTASRLCVRTVVCWSAFSLVPPLGSTCSSAARAASFAGFIATMGKSDFSGPFIVGFGLRPSRRGPCKTPQGQSRDIPVPEQGASAHARVFDDAEPTYVSRSRHGPYCLLQDGKHRRSEVGFRRSMAGLRYPLSTLRFAPHGSPRMNSGAVWFATPSPQRTFTSYLLPVSRRTRPSSRRGCRSLCKSPSQDVSR